EKAGKKIRCPHCSKVTLAPEPELMVAEADEAAAPVPPRFRLRVLPILAVLGLTLVITACSVYANLSFTVTNRVNFKYFPPFRPHHDANSNRHLGAEYFSIAKAIVAGEGFANAFREKTGPTARMPPVLPALRAAL